MGQSQFVCAGSGNGLEQAVGNSPIRDGIDILIDTLNELGFDYLFGHTGGAVLPIYDRINSRIDAGEKVPRVVMYAQEPGAGHAAEGYAKVNCDHKPGLVLVTSGPGATNLVTPIADAYKDSVPVIFLTGQVPSKALGTDAFQEVPIVQITNCITKYGRIITSTDEIGRELRTAYHIATSGRPGPVLLDICKDALLGSSTNGNDGVSLPGYHPDSDVRLNEKEADRLLEAFMNSEKPVIYAGGGVVSSNSSVQLREFANKHNVPVGMTLNGLGVIDGYDDLSLGMFGMHGSVQANRAAKYSDFILSLGSRFDDRVATFDFGENAQFGHVDIDAAEFSKVKKTDYPVHSGVDQFLDYALRSYFEREGGLREWHDQIAEWRGIRPQYGGGKGIDPREFISELSERTSGGAIITTGVGQHQMWVAQGYRFKEPRSLVSSGGLGTMGFGLPAAIGAYFANPDKTIINIDGDGSFPMNQQELATIVREKIPIKNFILNNRFLGLPRQWTDSFGSGGHFVDCLGRMPDCAPGCHGTNDCRNENPSFTGFTSVYNGLKAISVTEQGDWKDVIDIVLRDKEFPWIVDVQIDRFADVLPIIPAGKGIEDMILE